MSFDIIIFLLFTRDPNLDTSILSVSMHIINAENLLAYFFKKSTVILKTQYTVYSITLRINIVQYISNESSNCDKIQVNSLIFRCQNLQRLKKICGVVAVDNTEID